MTQLEFTETKPVLWIKCSECKTYIRKTTGWQDEFIIHYLDMHASKEFNRYETHLIVGKPIGVTIIPTGDRVTSWKIKREKEEDEILE